VTNAAVAKAMSVIAERMKRSGTVWPIAPADSITVRQDETSVADGAMLKLEAPPRTHAEIGEEAFDPEEEAGDAPPEVQIDRALAIARLGCMPERIGVGLQLLVVLAGRKTR
jgi:hypothetical protein